jgi:hypothetical protein
VTGEKILSEEFNEGLSKAFPEGPSEGRWAIRRQPPQAPGEWA